MKAITQEWLARAAEDLAAAEALLTRSDLTSVVAFHAQQAVEKALKAAIEELDLPVLRTHSLVRLYELVRPHYPMITDMDMLDRLEAVYIQSRYPGELGLLPGGKPSPEDAADFYNFARNVFQRIQASLEDAGAGVADGPESAP
ncbi:MAG: HEPN domain-containing protein [Litorilinea sp.]|nr:MAG: HEPN domain-containing protein [Litorilinea sp.]